MSAEPEESNDLKARVIQWIDDHDRFLTVVRHLMAALAYFCLLMLIVVNCAAGSGNASS